MVSMLRPCWAEKLVGVYLKVFRPEALGAQGGAPGVVGEPELQHCFGATKWLPLHRFILLAPAEYAFRHTETRTLNAANVQR